MSATLTEPAGTLMMPETGIQPKVFETATAEQLLLMLDSTTPSAFAGLKFDACAGYVPPSSWPDYGLECIDYPLLYKAHRIESITPSAFDDADIIDCENGDALPDQVPGWIDRQLARKVWRPGVYASLSTWTSGLLSALAHYGDKIRRWVADWTFIPAISVSWADAQQFTDRYANRNIDGSMCRVSFFPPQSQPVPHNELHYDWYDKEVRLTPYGHTSEHNCVRAYDEARKDPAAHHVYLSKLETQLRWLSGRTVSVARLLHPLPDGHANWRPDHLGWRHIHLARRGEGGRYV